MTKKKNTKEQGQWSLWKSRVMPFLWFGLGVLFVVSISNSISHQGQQQWKDILVNFDHSNEMQFLLERDVENIVLNCYNVYETSVKVNDVDLPALEKELEDHPYIQNAEAFFNGNGAMELRVTQGKPVARVYLPDGRDYYISEKAQKMPVSAYFTARVPICSGQLQDNGQDRGDLISEDLKALHQIAVFISKNEFWSALIEQIYRNKEEDFVLIPKIGQQEIVIGDALELDEKFSRIEEFYKNTVNRIGWDRYKSVNVEFDNKIVCKENKPSI